ncbi:unnamed protein product [Spirodela intermedia]|uniref:Peptidase A1 domain-containing protein n=1 Tax=Spirodela intermedia TaxID=51605 RepID=A0A7I8JAJ1_SPIIN|nr:unnamed protein product [Spirodela intermedia]CAA6667236.1 unnamed protein product [Spirodela intermedia]
MSLRNNTTSERKQIIKVANVADHTRRDLAKGQLWNGTSCSEWQGCRGIQLESFDPVASPTSSLISLNLCGYAFQYGDGSGTSGYYVSDTMHFESIISNEQIFNSSANIIFGKALIKIGISCSSRWILDLGSMGHLSSHSCTLGVSPKVFSHCLKGADNGGGILVLGEIVEPGLPHYNLNLRSIAVNGQILPIDSSVFYIKYPRNNYRFRNNVGYLAEEAYDPFVNAITASVLQVVQPRVIRGNQCFVTLSRVGEIFPFVTLIFEGNAQMVLKPEDYLLQQGSVGDAVIWCIGWQKSQGQGVTILGDIVLKDKIFVYDLVRQRLGWTNYDCSLPVNVSSSSSKNDVINAGQLSMSGCSSLRAFFNIMTVGCALVFYIWSCNKHDI